MTVKIGNGIGFGLLERTWHYPAPNVGSLLHRYFAREIDIAAHVGTSLQGITITLKYPGALLLGIEKIVGLLI
jgi:hypothetical protein